MSFTQTCALCDKTVFSLLVPRDKAMEELGRLLQAHLREQHPIEFQQFLEQTIEIQTLSLGVAAINRFIKADPLDTVTQNEYNAQISRFMDLLGFDKEIDEDEPLPDSLAPLTSR